MPILVLESMSNPDTNLSAQLRAMRIPGARIPPVAVSTGYRLALALGGLLASLFPLLYLALIPLCASAIFFLARAISSFHSLAASLAILLSGCLLIFSLLKPLVAPPAHGAGPHFLTAEKQRLLFAFVTELASGMGVPGPSRIAVEVRYRLA
jgi:hypothetical protein